MSRVITFSQFFPKSHPKSGQPTNFVEKIYKSLYLMKSVPKEIVEAFNFEIMNDNNIGAKHHTIRNGNRWKVGDKFSPRVWSGKPYASKQIIIASDIEIKKIWHFQAVGDYFYLNGKQFDVTSSDLPNNDGLSTDDFLAWFDMHPKKTLSDSFIGQILCWNENINYD